MNSRWFFLALVALSSAVSMPLIAETPRPAPAVINQQPVGPMACGPCSLVNALKFGGQAERKSVSALAGDDDAARVRSLIENYGRVPSDAYPDRTRYRDKGGMSDVEMLGMVRDFLKDAELKPVEGSPLDRTVVEEPGAHLRGVYTKLRGSLDAGFPPIVILRSFVVKPEPKPKKGADPFSWFGVDGHWLAIIDLPRQLDPGAISFTMKVADSWTGRPQECFVFEEQFRNFTAAKGDDRKWTWPTIARPYLVVTMPAVSLGTKDMPWYLRSNVVLSYGIYRK